MRIALFLLFFMASTMSYAKTIVITSATSGISTALIEDLISKDHKLILIARNQDKLEALAQQYSDHVLQTMAHDYLEIEDVQKKIEGIIEPIDGLVVISPRPKLSDNLLPSPESWGQMFNKCFIGPMEVVKHLLPKLSQGSSIVIVSGISSKQVMPKHAAYGVLRGMWLNQAKGLSYQLGERGIRVNTVSPGGTLTQSYLDKLNSRAEKSGRTQSEQIAIETDNIPLGKYATPMEVAKTIAFFLSDDASQISGTNLSVDGGFVKAY